MSVQVRRRREAASFLTTFVGAQGELLVDTTNNRVQVHDGSTPGGFPAAKLSEVITNTRTSVADANYTVLSMDRTIAYTAITAARTVTLPAASAYPTGTQLFVFDEGGTCSASNTITVARTGSDLINGAASTIVASAYGFVALESNGVSRWTLVDQSAGAAASTVAITGGTIDATPIGATTRSTGGFTTLAVTSSLSLPTNSLANLYLAQMPTLTLKSNIAGAAATPADSTLSAILDASQGSTRGAILYRGLSGWSVLAPGSSGTVLTANGTGADPSYQAAGGTSSLSVPVRQTVMGGPALSGAPNFLPTTSGSLTLTAQNVSTGAGALTLTAAQGFSSNGALNLVYQFTSNPAWTLAASATNYLFVNISTGATSTQTSQPIYQFGGTLSAASGQFTFDYQAMMGYLGNGTTAVATPLVCVGEAVATASTVTSTIAYAYNGFYDSGYTGPLPVGNTATPIIFASNIGVSDAQTRLRIKNTTADNGYSVGDVICDPHGQSTSAYANNIPTFGTRLTAGFIPGAQVANSWDAYSKTTGLEVALTRANWAYAISARRPWGGS